MERLSEAPVVHTRAIRRRKSLTDGVAVFDGSSASPFSWRSVFQRKAEFERLLQHRMNHSSVGVLPALSRSNSAVAGRDQAKRRQLTGRRLLGQPRSANALALANLPMTPVAMPPRVNAVDLTCLEITAAVMTSPTLSPRHRFPYERLDYIKRNHPDNHQEDKSRDLKPELISNGVPVRRSLSFTRSVSNYRLESKTPPNGLANGVYEDAMELKSMLKDSKQRKPTSAVSRVEATQKPLCDRKASSDMTQKTLCDRKTNTDMTHKPVPGDKKANSESFKKSGGKSILKRIREKFEKDVKLTPTKNFEDNRPAGNNIKDVSFDGISNLKACIVKNKQHSVEVKRRKNYRLFGSASTQSSQRSVRFSVSDTIYEYDSET